MRVVPGPGQINLSLSGEWAEWAQRVVKKYPKDFDGLTQVVYAALRLLRDKIEGTEADPLVTRSQAEAIQAQLAAANRRLEDLEQFLRSRRH